MIDDRPTIALEGEFDLANTAHLRETILGGLNEMPAPTLVVDCSGVTFLDSSALRALLEVRSHLAKRGVELVITEASEPARRVLEITHTAELFHLS